MSKERGDFLGESKLSNPIPFQDELWKDSQTASMYGARNSAENTSWTKYVGDGAKDLELFEGQKPIEFTNHLFNAYQRAVAENKPLVVEFSQDNCNHCEKLNKETFRSDEMKQLSDKAIWVRVDPTKHEDEKGNVGELAKELGIDRYPTTVVLDVKADSMRELGRIVGYFPGKQFSENMKQILPEEKKGNNVFEFSSKPADKQNAA
jgi:thioredoxin-related protein